MDLLEFQKMVELSMFMSVSMPFDPDNIVRLAVAMFRGARSWFLGFLMNTRSE